MHTRKSIFFTRDLARVQLLKILSRQATQRKIGNRTTERLLLGRFIFFHRVVGVFNYSRYQGRQKQSKNRKLTKSSMKTRQFIFFTQLFGRVQLLKILSRQATQRKIGNLTTERPLLGRFIFFHRVVDMFSFQDTNHHKGLILKHLNLSR